jgi:hypothetical protein
MTSQPFGKIAGFERYLGIMSNPLHPDLMEPAERLVEIAEILAMGLMRLNARKSSNLSPAGGESLLDCPGHQSSHADGLKSHGGSE